jgi:hypothetical protein
MTLMQAGFILILLGATLPPDSRARAVGALAAVTAGLALAGLTAAPAPVHTGLPPGFAAADAALLGLAALLALTAAVMARQRGGPGAAKAGAIAQAVGAGVLGWGGANVLAQAPPGATAGALLVAVATGLLLLVPGRFVRPATPESAGPPPRPVAGVVGLVVGALAVAAGPHLSVVVIGAVLAGWSGYLLERAAGGSRLPIAPALTLILLPAWWLMATVAGPEGLWMGSLAAVPLSPAAERLLAPAFVAGAWALCGLWPLHRQMPAAFSAPVGALLLTRVALPAVSDGLEHWRALAMPLMVAGAWHAALTGRTARLAVALAWVGLLAPDGQGVAGAALLVAAPVLAELAGPIARADTRLAAGIRIALGLAVGCGGLLAVTAGLRGEVVYTVLAVGAVVAAAGRALAAQARTASDPRTTAPSA